MAQKAAVVVAVGLVAAGLWSAPAWAASRTWTGSGPPSVWSHAPNWAEGAPPASGDSVVLTNPTGASFGASSVDDLAAGTVLSGIEFTGSHRVSSTGKEKVLVGPIVLRAPHGGFDSPLVLGADVEVRTTRMGTGSGIGLGDVLLDGRRLTITGDADADVVVTGPGQVHAAGPGFTRVDGDGPDIGYDISNGYASALGDFGPVTLTGGSISVRGSMTSFTAHGGRAGMTAPSFAEPWLVTGDVFLGAGHVFDLNLGLDGAMTPVTVGGRVRIDSARLGNTALIIAGREQGRVLTVIDKVSAGPVEGTFADLPEGAVIAVPNAVVRLSYVGGDGNDVTLTVLDAGYLTVDAVGATYNFGNQPSAGGIGFPLTRPIVGADLTPTRQGYWLAATDGGIFAFGDAGYFGSTGAMRLNQPIVGMTATPSGRGYWLVASDGGIFSFGDAAFHGSTGAMRLNQPIVGMASTPSGMGYWLVASDGGVFTFGDAAFHGSTGDLRLNRPILAMAASRTGGGYWFLAADGGVFAFGDAPFLGTPLQRLPKSTSTFVALAG